MLSRILLVGLACSSYGQTYCSYNNVGWCRGGPDTSIRNADNSQPRSLDECWNRCSSRYGGSLVSADRWPNNIHFGIDLCYCQTACTSISRENVEMGVQLAIRSSRVPSGLASCNRSTYPPPPSPRPPPTTTSVATAAAGTCRSDICGDIGNDCCAPGSERKSCRESGYTVTTGGTTTSIFCPRGSSDIYQCCPSSGGSASHHRHHHPPSGPAYCTYNNVGWCTGGADTPMRNRDGSDARSVEQCWDLCSARYNSSLVAVDRWLNNDRLGLPKCFCQTGCTSITRQHVDDAGPVEIAIRPASIPSSSRLTSCASGSQANNGTGYQVNNGTGNTCESGLPITDVGACRAAASALRKRFRDDVDIPGTVSDGVGRFDYAPGGCFEYYGNSTRSSTTFTMPPGIYFNTHPGSSSARAGHHKVCTAVNIGLIVGIAVGCAILICCCCVCCCICAAHNNKKKQAGGGEVAAKGVEVELATD